MDEQLDFGILLDLAYTAFVEGLHASLREAGFEDIGFSFGYVFRALADGPLTLTDLATRFRMTSQGAAKIVKPMEEAGYVVRRPDPVDARAKRIELTERGRGALAAARRFHHDFEARLAEELGAGRAAGLRDALTSIATAGSEDRRPRPFRPF